MNELVRIPGMKPTKTPSLEARMKRGLLTMLEDRIEDVERELHGSPQVKASYDALSELIDWQKGALTLDAAVNGYAATLVTFAYLRGIREGMELARGLSGEALAAVAGVPLVLDFPAPDEFELAEFGIAGYPDSIPSPGRRPGSTAKVEAEDPSPQAASSATE